MRRYSMLLILLPFFMMSGRSQDTPAQGSPFSQAKFVPDISVILDVSYLHRSLSDEQNAELFLPGFLESGEHSPPCNGLNLNYAEITFYSIVDPYFELFAICHLSPEHFHLEEAYWLTRKLPAGFQFKAGKFLSAFGRINELHAHYWDFADRPLVHRAMFGDEGLNEIGACITWVAPTDIYLLLGAEMLMGENEPTFGRTGFSLPRMNIAVSGVKGPGLFVGYVESSVDIGDASVLVRLSGAHGKTRFDGGLSSGIPGSQAITGTSTVLGCALTVKHTLDAIRYISFQSEYLWRHTDGTLYSLDQAQQLLQSALEKRQTGLYAQAVAKFGLQMRGGLRVDLLHGNEVIGHGLRSDLPTSLPRYSAMLEFNPTEFSRIRLQYNYDLSRYTETNEQLSMMKVHELSLQINLAIGAHGAHSF